MNDLRIHLAFPYAASDDLSVLRAEIQDQNFRVSRAFWSLHTLRMCLRHAVLRGWIVRRSLHWSYRSLTGNAALELLLNLTSGALFERVRAATQGQQCNCQRNRKGPHLLIL